jgi:hypothetical protein
MTTQETATQKGVPMPETCKELDWKTETLFYWHTYDNIDYWKITFGEPQIYDVYGKSKVVPAPQIHEILEVLPKEIPQEHAFRNEITMTFCFDKWFVGYSCEEEIEHENLVEALALLYLQIKERNLL